MSTPTAERLRAARMSYGFTQEELAERMRGLGYTTITVRSVQRWESGDAIPNRTNIRALAATFGLSPDELGPSPVIEDATGGRHVRAWAPFTPPPEVEATPSNGRLEGVWLSRYQYWSSGRAGLYISQYHCIVSQKKSQVDVLSLPRDQEPRLELTLTAEGHILTGRWDEWTAPGGHYLGDHRWGALQLFVTPNRRYMHGRWVGWGSGGLMNSGPWELTWLTGDTSEAGLAPYDRSLYDEPV